jgi:hypothetical protein
VFREQITISSASTDPIDDGVAIKLLAARGRFWRGDGGTQSAVYARVGLE